ncbi:MAG: undecaprenyl-diphosphate phosphatase [Treponema bryantii]|nr:undecaprenyl-diphosphate phosphatase [Treponema bryantii]
MTVLQGFLLGILQGVAEFLPISSSGHLALAQSLFGLEDVPLLYDIFLHMATLLAVTIYFWPKIWALLKCFGRWITKKQKSDNQVQISENDLLCPTDKIGQKTIIAIILTTAITGAFGIFTSKLIPDLSIKFVCGGFLVTSALLIISSIMEKRQSAKGPNEFTGISIKQSIIIGIMQGFGTLPGISRSGSTIAGALFGGVNRSLAGEFSFIVSIPAILGAFILELKDLGQMSSSIGAAPIIAGCISSFAVGYFSLSVLMKIIKKGKLQWFAAYLIPAGILGLIFLK